MKYIPTIIYPTSTREGLDNLNIFKFALMYAGFSVAMLGFSQTGALAMFPRRVKHPSSINLTDISVTESLGNLGLCVLKAERIGGDNIEVARKIRVNLGLDSNDPAQRVHIPRTDLEATLVLYVLSENPQVQQLARLIRSIDFTNLK